MKTFWKNYLPHEDARRKQLAFEAKTGVKWDFYSNHGGTKFTPVITRETQPDETLGMKVLPYVPTGTSLDGIGFVDLAEMTRLPLPDVLSGAQWLIKSAKAGVLTNRYGNCAGIYLYRRSK